MKSSGTHPNPLIQSLQLAGVDWLWPNESLSSFWRTTTKVMSLAGWSGFSNPWTWKTVCIAHLRQLGFDPDEDESLSLPIRIEVCLAVWFEDRTELKEYPQAAQALLTVYLPHANTQRIDMLAALFWASLLSFEMQEAAHPLARELTQWRLAQPNAISWLHAFQTVHPFGMELLPMARYMLRIVEGYPQEESTNVEGLLV